MELSPLREVVSSPWHGDYMPGPWKASGRSILAGDGRPIAYAAYIHKARCADGVTAKATSEATMRLIAAAPEMLDILMAIQHEWVAAGHLIVHEDTAKAISDVLERF